MNFRSLVTPLAGVFILLSFNFFMLKNKRFSDIFSIYSLLFCLYVLTVDVYTSKPWYHSMSSFKKIVDTKKGCYLLPKDSKGEFSKVMFAEYFFGIISSLFPRNGKIETLVMPGPDIGGINVCDNFDESNQHYFMYSIWGGRPYIWNVGPVANYLTFRPKRKLVRLTEQEKTCDQVKYISFSNDPLKFTTKGMVPGQYRVYMGVSGVQEVSVQNEIEIIFNNKKLNLFPLEKYQSIDFDINVKKAESIIYIRQTNLVKFQNLYEKMTPYFGVNCFFC